MTDSGGEITVSLAPIGDAGVSFEFTRPGMTADELEAYIDESQSQYPDCPAPHVGWAIDGATDEPLWGELSLCIADAEFASTSACDSPATLILSIEGGSGQTWLELDPVSNAVAGDQITVNHAITLTEPIDASTTLSAEVQVDGDCLGEEAVPELLSVTWDFPDHDDRVVRVKNDYSGPLVAIR